MQKECNTSLKQHAKQKGTTSVCCVVFLFLLCFGFLFHNTTQGLEKSPLAFSVILPLESKSSGAMYLSNNDQG
jgi:hypothetical protein